MKLPDEGDWACTVGRHVLWVAMYTLWSIRVYFGIDVINSIMFPNLSIYNALLHHVRLQHCLTLCSNSTGDLVYL